MGFGLKKEVSKGFSWHIESQSFGFHRTEDYATTLWAPLHRIDTKGQRGGMRYVPTDIISGEYMYSFVDPAVFRCIQERIDNGGIGFDEYVALRDEPLNSSGMNNLLEYYAVEDDFELGDVLLFDKYVIHRSARLEEGPLEVRDAFSLRFICEESLYDRDRAHMIEIPRNYFGYAGPDQVPPRDLRERWRADHRQQLLRRRPRAAADDGLSRRRPATGESAIASRRSFLAMEQQVRHYESKLAFEIDSWDVYEAQKAGAAVAVLDVRPASSFESGTHRRRHQFPAPAIDRGKRRPSEQGRRVRHVLRRHRLQRLHRRRAEDGAARIQGEGIDRWPRMVEGARLSDRVGLRGSSRVAGTRAVAYRAVHAPAARPDAASAGRSHRVDIEEEGHAVRQYPGHR